MGSPHDGGARVGHCGHARFADQAHIVPLQGCRQQRACVKHRGAFVTMVSLFVDFAGEFGDLLGLNGGG